MNICCAYAMCAAVVCLYCKWRIHIHESTWCWFMSLWQRASVFPIETLHEINKLLPEWAHANIANIYQCCTYKNILIFIQEYHIHSYIHIRFHLITNTFVYPQRKYTQRTEIKWNKQTYLHVCMCSMCVHMCVFVYKAYLQVSMQQLLQVIK